MALSYFDQLLKIVTDDERRAIDEFIAEHESFTVYTNLARRVQPLASNLIESSSTEDGAARQGLAWVMAWRAD